MNNDIIEIINRNFEVIRNNPEYYLKIEAGKFQTSNVFEQLAFNMDLLNYLNKNKKMIIQKEYYQYQHQNQYYQRQRNFKSLSFTDSLVDLQNYRKESTCDYRITLNKRVIQPITSNHMSYHNILFVEEKEWQITENCNLCILKNIKKNKGNNPLESFNVYFKITIPISKTSIEQFLSELDILIKFFIRKYDKSHMFRSLDLVLESEQPHQESYQDNEPLHHHEE
jgi:hypothetical protein